MKIASVVRALIAYIKLRLYKLSGVDVSCSVKNHFGKRVSLYFDKGAKIVFGRDIGLRDNVCVSARNNAEIVLGENVFLNNGCQLIAHKSITLGKNVKCGQNTMFFDHDYDYCIEGGCSTKQFNCSPIIVGEGTWIGAGCIILRGTIIGSNCVIGAGTVVKGEIPNNTILVQKRENILKEIIKKVE